MLTIDEASPWTIVGVDCASQDAHIGLARGTLSSAGLLLEQVQIGGSRETSVAQRVASWLQGPRVLLAIDAPLGWPRPLADALQEHRAGLSIASEATHLVRRETDRQVAAALGKTPLDVAADRIAYAAHRALRLLGELREATGLPLPLLWQPAPGVGAIEVYPAATLRACSIDASGYKNKATAHRDAARSARQRLLGCLQTRLTISRELADAILAARREDMLDAAVCVLAGADFLHGHCAPPAPAELPLAQQEGWIWVRRATT
jgi:hypothetical protein